MHPATKRAKHGFVQQHGLRESQTKRLVKGIRFHSSCWYYSFSESRMFRLPEVFPVDRGNHSMFWKVHFFGTTLYLMLEKLCSHHSIVFVSELLDLGLKESVLGRWNWDLHSPLATPNLSSNDRCEWNGYNSCLTPKRNCGTVMCDPIGIEICDDKATYSSSY